MGSVRRLLTSALGALLALAVVSTAVVPAATAAGTTQSSVASAVPSSQTPHAVDGRVFAITQVGGTVVMGGSFTQVMPADRSATWDMPYLVAFDAATGAVQRSFLPGLDGEVEALLPGPAAGTVYVGGFFLTARGTKAKGLVLLRLSDGARVTSFATPSMNGGVNTLARSGGRLLVGGTFTALGGQARGGLASLSETTGAVDGFLASSVAENHNWRADRTGAARAAVGVSRLDVTPDGRRMVAVGNFRTVDGLPRDQVAMWDLTGSRAVVRADWRTRGFEASCLYKAYDSYLRDVAFSPDGSYFAVATTGGGNTTLCDTATRWETAATGDDVKPTWVASAGGDTVLSVAVTGTAVYAGGHQRWMNNAAGNDAAGAGAVPRPGIAALDPRTGLPLAWNPGRNPRGAGAFALYTTPTGLWVGSDTNYVGDYRYRRQKLAFFPLAGGAARASDAVPVLPAGVYQAGAALPAGTPAVSADGLVRRDLAAAGAGAPAVVDTTGRWSGVRAATLVGGTLFYGRTDGLLYRRSFDGQVLGPESVVDPYGDPAWATVQTGSGGTFRGAPPTFYGGEVASLTSLAYDGEGRLYYTLAGQRSLYWRAFSPDSGIVGGTRTAVPGVVLPDTTGMFVAGGSMYLVPRATGELVRHPLTSGALGSGTVVSGPRVDGADWRSPLLFIGPLGPRKEAPVAVADVRCTDLSCAVDGTGSHDPDGSVASYRWDFGDGTTAEGAVAEHTYATAGEAVVTLTVVDDEGVAATTTRPVTVAPAPNAAPVAVVDVACEELVCELSGGRSVDEDGSVTSWAWDFGDGSSGAGESVSHAFAAAGEYAVRLVVTDDRGATGEVVEQVPVSPAPVSSVAFRAQAGGSGLGATAVVAVPGEVRAGDALVVAVTSGTATQHQAPAGWSEVARATSGTALTTVWQKVASASDAGSSVGVVMTGMSGDRTKFDVRLLAYSGTAAVDPVRAVAAPDARSTSSHEAPASSVRVPGSWVVRYWADKSSSTTAWSLPAGVEVRSVGYGSGTGYVSAVVADDARAWAAGEVPALSAGTDASSRGTGATLVIAPAS